MSSAINSLKRNLGMGARTNRYKIILVSPTFQNSEILDVMAKEANLPGRSFNDVEVWVQGRLITVAGDSDYAGTWNITFLDSEEHFIRGVIQDWMEYIDSVKQHDRGAGAYMDYMTNCKFQQLSTVDNSVKAEYELYDVYPKSISEISYSDENSGLVEFSAEFNFSHYSRTR